MSNDDIPAFHRRVAEQLVALYGAGRQAPQEWREALAWHWEQAGAYAEAAEVGLDVAEARMARLDFTGARRWAERALALIDRLDPERRADYDLRAYALALAVLEFGGQYREALDYARRMLAVAQARNNNAAIARAYLSVGRMQRELGQFGSAEVVLQQARALLEGDDLSELGAEIRLHLAKVHQMQGRHLEALQELQLAQEQSAQHDDRDRLARVLTSIGDIYRVLGSARESMSFYTRALSLEQGRGNLLGQAILRDKLALALLEQGKLPEALANEEESLRLRQSINDVPGQARARSVLGTIMSRLGRYDEARAHQEWVLRTEEQLQNPRGQGIALMHLGNTDRATRKPARARELYSRALAVARRDNDQIGVARALERLGDLAYEERQPDRATEHWNESLQIREALHHADEAAALRERLHSGPPLKR